MRFDDSKAIYLQIADYVCDQILSHTWHPEQKLPSTREFAVALEVNPNTIIRSYNHLEDNKIIIMKRGVGYFVSTEAIDYIMSIKKKRFIEEEIPRLVKVMKQLQLTPEAIQAYIKQETQRQLK